MIKIIQDMADILPALETGRKTSLAEVPIPFPAGSVAGDWKTLCNNIKKENYTGYTPQLQKS